MHAWVVRVLENFAQVLIGTDNVPIYLIVNALLILLNLVTIFFIFLWSRIQKCSWAWFKWVGVVRFLGWVEVVVAPL